MLYSPRQSLPISAIPQQRSPEPERRRDTSTPPRPTASVPSRDKDTPWHAEAVCRRDEAGLFFAPSKEPTAARLSREDAAKRVCAGCPVRVECREHALVQPEPYGVWGGLTAAERRVLLARRRRRAVATAR
ncbi:WhiB family transcriptional regulator [Streptomyces sp. SID11385]|uniref:WhiB family transcriptional regulator n=1 Tax=Streptomyces sp. SID11385 TaxID=2706031 RepID=UPI0013CD2305|nr:WhiB family transcriptional regulator [Streptomyces sp. SID11385]